MATFSGNDAQRSGSLRQPDDLSVAWRQTPGAGAFAASAAGASAAQETKGDDAFEAATADALAGLPGVLAVALGGSRASGTARPDSDWDFAIYYRGPAFDPQALAGLGWDGQVFPIGGWGGGVFNGGAWLRSAGRQVDVHYRDLDDVEFRIAEAEAGRFGIERLAFHLAGVPTYIVVAELAGHRVLRGELPRPQFPAALRASAAQRWTAEATHTLDYAARAHAGRGHLTETAGAIGTAVCQASHAILAARGEWVTNEKALVDRAGLRGVDQILAGLRPEPAALAAAVDATRQLIAQADGT
jgi:Nucleotidyltransferase domain